MRLLHYNNDGDFSLTEFFRNIPPYAILSHTWGLEEVTFRDMTERNGASKTGFDKIQFCGEQARRDGFQYFWVDTCCIDKSNSTELAEAINSMFRWYRDAAKCYVYLPDVSSPVIGDKSDQLLWDMAFRASRWFTRGWTLQELIAPTSVEFFSKNRKLLGDRKSLERHICEITGIPCKALRGSPLSEFSTTERMSWAETRQTTREEDMAYSLLGMFDVYMPLLYGEGRANAVGRLQEAIDRKEKGIKYEDFSIPFSLSAASDIEHFVAREDELREIHKALSGDGSRHTVILHGLGGIGKTQLAIAYAKRHKGNYSAIFWLNIKDEDSLKQSFVTAAKQILREHPSASRLTSVDMKGDLTEVIDGVKAWLSLSNNTRWLVIYDNYDNPKSARNADPTVVDIRHFLPESHQGSVIITTRSSEVKIGRCLPITKLQNVQDSLKILSNTSGREALENNADAVRLVEKLDGLPLALATAGAYLNQVAMSFLDYLHHYKDSWAKLQKTSPELSSYEDRTLYSTWQISIDHVERRNVLSARLLRFWAYFGNQDLWFELLRHGDSKNLDWLRELTKDELSFHEAMRVLSDHGLVEAHKPSLELVESRGYSIHGCVHSWTVHVLNKEWDYNLAKVAVQSVALHTYEGQADRPWMTERRLLQHAARCFYIILKDLLVDDDMDWVYFNFGLLYANQGKLALAEQMYERALRGYEKALGAEHTSTLDTVNNLGNLYKNQGKLALAEQMYERALRGKEKAFGAEHTSTLQTVNNLGALYADQGKLALAEQMYERALRGKEKAFGAEHMSTLDTVNNLGILYADQGKLALAEQMYERALRGKEKAFGAEYMSTLDTVNNLGNLYKNQGKLALAEQMYERALRGKEKAFGAEHTSTLDTVNNLGNLYKNQGKLALAEQMYERALRGYEKALSAEHTSTLQTVNNLGILYADQGKLALAEQMYERALRGKEKALGAEHTSTLQTVNNLGALYADQGKLALAEQMYERALRGKEKAFGAEHTSTLDTVNNLGILYADQGKLALAEQMYERALRGKEKAFGAEHTSTLDTVNNLGILYADQGKLALAEQMYERALRGYETALGINNITTYIPALNTLWGLGSLFKLQADFTKARIMYLKALTGYKKVVGPKHPKCQSLQEILQDLETITEGEAMKGREEPATDPQENVSRLDSKGALSTSKRHRLFRKLGLRQGT
ncbi:hypothetical protein B0O99DRAFT_582895 [Bisporella sp. PMI_857]|nr:hypothetical protein B0O99DRAFT_582895 [Bisporella sp. PMI_857]